MATQLTLVNDVLSRLREDEVSTVNENAYSTLIAGFINDAIDDANNAWFWSVYNTSVNVSILTGTTSYNLPETNDRSFLRRHVRYDVPLAFDDTLGESPFPLELWTENERTVYRTEHDFENTSAKPSAFSLVLASDGRSYDVNLVDEPTENRTWTLYWYVPQHDLATRTDDDASTEILLPSNFVRLRAIFYALEERGEVLGPREASQQWLRSQDALSAAIEIDQQLQKRNEEYDMYNNESLVRQSEATILSVS